VVLYSDEDKIDEHGARTDPFFKPDWDPDLLLGQNYLNHLTVMRRTAVLAAGGLNSAFDGAQDHDLILRVTEGVPASDIVHIPQVLYHWRATSGSTALSISEKPHVVRAAHDAVSAALRRRGVDGVVTPVENAPYQRVTYPAPNPPVLASIVIPTRDRHDLLDLCLTSLDANTGYARREVVIVDNGTVQPAALDLMESWRRAGKATIVRDDGDFNFSRLINRGVAASKGEVVVLLNNDIEIIERDWLTELVAQACRPGVGCVGAKLLYPNDTVQHAGVVLGMGGIAGHWQAGAEMHDLGYGARLALTWRPSAVTAACLATPRSTFNEVGGFDEDLTVSFNDVDYCLRVRAAGQAVVWTPHAVLKHHESASRGRDDVTSPHAPVETELMQNRWGALIARDPAFNPNLSLTSQTTRLRL
jgi:GT2 family glycosyltransferase